MHKFMLNIKSMYYKILRNREHIVVRTVFWLGIIGIVSFASLLVADLLTGSLDTVHLVGLIFASVVTYTAQFADRFDFLEDED